MAESTGLILARMSIEMRPPVVFGPLFSTGENRGFASAAVHRATDQALTLFGARSVIGPQGIEHLKTRDRIQNLIHQDRLVVLWNRDVRRYRERGKFFEIGFSVPPGESCAYVLTLAINPPTSDPTDYYRWFIENADVFSNTLAHLPGVYDKARQSGIQLIGAQEFLERTIGIGIEDCWFLTDDELLDSKEEKFLAAEIGFDEVCMLAEKIIKDHLNSKEAQASESMLTLTKRDFVSVLPVGRASRIKCVEARFGCFSGNTEQAGICVLLNIDENNIFKNRNEWTDQTRRAVYELIFVIPYMYKRATALGYRLCSARDLVVLREKRGDKNFNFLTDLSSRVL